MQYPKEPKLTMELWPLVEFVSSTRITPMEFMTGEEMVVMRSRIVAANKRNVPMWWKNPVFAILKVFV